jgi:hypothetical protein
MRWKCWGKITFVLRSRFEPGLSEPSVCRLIPKRALQALQRGHVASSPVTDAHTKRRNSRHKGDETSPSSRQRSFTQVKSQCLGGMAPPFLTSALDGDEWSASCSSRFTPGIHSTGDWVGPRTGINALEKEETRAPGRVIAVTWVTRSGLRCGTNHTHKQHGSIVYWDFISNCPNGGTDSPL